MSRSTLKLNQNARAVLEHRYLMRGPNGAVAETPEQLLERVARAVAGAESRAKAAWAERFYEFMAARRFLPNSPTLMNAGLPGRPGQLAACFVLPIGDSLASIFDTLKYAALIHQSGGGTGFAFSALRPQGARVRSAHGVASGPVSFIRIFDVATETIKQGGARRGANMAVLRVDHPDILEFIDSKRDLRSIGNFNISVGITAEFMKALAAGSEFALREPESGKAVRRLPAQELFDRLVRAAWESGDPGLVFLDRINFFNPTPAEGAMESTNPCGEQPLLPYESCNLGSLNVASYARAGGFDWELFRKDIELAVRFLDNVVDINAYPVPECERITRRNRKVGLGVMGFADLLLQQGIRYGSPESERIGEELMATLDREAKRASAALAREKGAFPGYGKSLWKRLGYPPLRNATVSTVAPTGTISIIAGASSGIEPIFAGNYVRNVLGGQRLAEVHPALASPAWVPAHEVTVEQHVRMQAVFQRHTDSAVSKTINLPEGAPVSAVGEAYRLAYRLGCKGITVYRDKSREAQVLERTVEGKGRCTTC